MRSRFDVRGLVLPVGLLALWWAVTAAGWVDTRLIVPPSRVLRVGTETLADPLFWQGVGYSLARDAAGFALGALAGVGFGALLGLSRGFDRLLGPSFHVLRQISLFAWLPLLTAWWGYGEPAKLVFISLSTFYPVALATIEGVRSVTQAHREVARVFAFTGSQWLLRLVLPAAAPKIAAGLTLGLVCAWVATIGSEYLLANWGHGLGNLIIKGRAAFNVELIVVGLLCVGAIGALLQRLAAAIEARALRWQQRPSFQSQ